MNTKYDLPCFTTQRWPDPPTYGIPDPQQADPLCRCACCGLEVYPGDAAYTDAPNAPDGPGAVTVHQDCLTDWVCDLGDEALANAFGFHPVGP